MCIGGGDPKDTNHTPPRTMTIKREFLIEYFDKNDQKLGSTGARFGNEHHFIPAGGNREIGGGEKTYEILRPTVYTNWTVTTQGTNDSDDIHGSILKEPYFYKEEMWHAHWGEIKFEPLTVYYSGSEEGVAERKIWESKKIHQ